MALVCDLKSEPAKVESKPENAEDLEDGEIEDGEIEDDDEAMEEQPPAENTAPQTVPPKQEENKPEKIDRDRPRDRSRERRDKRHKEKETRHMTEAEKSILHLRRKERMEREREKWNRRKEHQNIEPQDDFAIKLEKTLASILKKDRVTSDDDKEEERRGTKRKRKDKEGDHGAKHFKSNSASEVDEKEIMNIRGGSPDPAQRLDKDERPKSPRSEGSYDSEPASDLVKQEDKGNRGRRESRREGKKNNKNKNKNRDRNFKKDNKNRDSKVEPTADSKGICIFYLNGKCNKNDCIYSHEAVPPMKLELCKFYLMDCCAKGDNCSYMHSDFPCKFYHMGLPCNMGDKCKFSHGDPLSDDAKSKNSEKTGRNKPSRWQAADPKEKVSNAPMNFGPFNFTQDQDMRINSNGDIDMRTLPPHPLSSLPQPLPSSLMSSDLSRMSNNPIRNSTGDVDIRNMTPNFASDVDIRLQSTFEVPEKNKSHQNQSAPFLGSKDVDIRQLGPPPSMQMEEDKGAHNKTNDSEGVMNIPPNMPKMQRELYMRIQSQQKENTPVYNKYDANGEDDLNNDEDWYSDDDDEHRLTIKVDNEETETPELKEEKTEALEFPGLPVIAPLPAKPQEVVEKLGDLSKINITADITKLLSSLSSSLPSPKTPESSSVRDPRQAKSQATINSPSRSPTSASHETAAPFTPRTLFDPRLTQDPKVNQAAEAPRDPRKGATAGGSKSDKMSIYEQGGLNLEDGDASDAYKASSRPDVDLRTLGLPFKGMESYTPATEIDASFSTHLPIAWKVIEVDVPRPDYSGLKLSLDEAEKTGDPRLRKIFRLSVEERDTPLSPKASPQRPTGVRIDPRLRKVEEAKSLSLDSSSMSYTQQLNTLQSSAFYQSLTSNQKLMLNQELASRSDQTGSHDPILNSILASLNLVPGMGVGGNVPQGHGSNFGVAANILQSINKMNTMSQMGPNMMNPNNAMLNPMGQGVIQPGLLGAAPGIPNMPQQEFPMNFDPRTQNGLLGNGPPQQFPTFEPPPGQGSFQNYPNDDYYPPENNNQGGFRGNQGRNDRGGNFNNRERRRGGRNNNNFGRNQGNRNNQFRRNQGGGGRSNKGHNQS
ncbi:protein suppressor of sable isoform X2 [Coccinella septempunctata]|uniref:protein suppressor of sable isoform X2 n=1 Tax=Coccinella septempunctata TaxID=41139 RepID=UPI001D05CFD4|nr:protein suppressor of sable isoform X2 [Coccinella septempunctata]